MQDRGRPPVPRLRDVAERAGVSVSLVSSYLNRPDEVGSKSSERIREAIDHLDFSPNDAARQLRRGVSRMIAFVAFDVSDAYFASVVRGAQRRAAPHGLSVVLADTDGRRETETEYLRLFGEQRVRGLLLAPVAPPVDYVAEPGLRRTPTVFMDQRAPSERYGSVVVNDVVGGRLAGEHLLSLGRRRLTFVGGPQDLRQVRDRIRGLRDAADGYPDASVRVVDSAERNAAAGRDAARRLLDLPRAERPDAVFAVNDTVAGGVLVTFLAAGARVPEDVAIVGYNDIAAETSSIIPLTSIRQPHDDFGAAAVDLLIEDERADTSAARRHIVFEPELVVRQSSAG